jgi:hypothetical protein
MGRRGARGRTGVFDGLTLIIHNTKNQLDKESHNSLYFLSFKTKNSGRGMKEQAIIPYWRRTQNHTATVKSSNCTFSLQE